MRPSRGPVNSVAARGTPPGASFRPQFMIAHGCPGYTPGMKTAVSVPDDIYEQAERLARRTGRSRSEIYSTALREYVAHHIDDEVTAALDSMADLVGVRDPLVVASARHVLTNVEW